MEKVQRFLKRKKESLKNPAQAKNIPKLHMFKNKKRKRKEVEQRRKKKGRD